VSALAEELEEPEKAEPEAEGDASQFYMERRPDLEPTEFKEGFTLKTVLGALFVGIIMMPGAIYLGLMVGQDLGPAAEWTTIILFTEVARRSFTVLTRQELYIIYYMAGSLTYRQAWFALAGGAFAWLVWNQYLVNSPAATNFGIADKIPTWVAPRIGSEAYVRRTFFDREWLVPIALLIATSILGRMQWIGLGYFLFRTTSDVERLPFPLAPIAAQGATALAEVSGERESWRWAVFSVGTMVGLIYGFFYVAIPVITGGFLADPLKLIPIPFIDLMPNTENVFPAGRIALGTELGAIFTGFVLPFPIVAGAFIGTMVSNFLFAPILYRINAGIFSTWSKGMSLIQTEMAVGFDLYMSIGIGLALAIAVIGFYTVIGQSLRARIRRSEGLQSHGYADVPPGRGDFPIWLALAAWTFSTICYIVLAHALVPNFSLAFLIAFAFLWTPMISYMSARFLGLAGRTVEVPYVAQATFILSGYKGVDIWFAPVPFFDHGWAAQRFREVELTGTRMVSVVKAEAFLLVIMLVFSFIYWSFYWRSSQIPSSQYPYAQTYWPLAAFYQCLWATATVPSPTGQPTFLIKALKFPIIAYAGGASLALYLVLIALRVPALWFYGFITGFPANTAWWVPTFIGALLGKYYFGRRFGARRWMQYSPVLAAGYACGIGLIGMFSIGLTIIFKAVRSLPF
jgi:hypothetical protein